MRAIGDPHRALAHIGQQCFTDGYAASAPVRARPDSLAKGYAGLAWYASDIAGNYRKINQLPGNDGGDHPSKSAFVQSLACGSF